MFEFYQTYLINNKRKKSLHNNETFMDLECKSSHKKSGQLKLLSKCLSKFIIKIKYKEKVYQPSYMNFSPK